MKQKKIFLKNGNKIIIIKHKIYYLMAKDNNRDDFKQEIKNQF